jgi:hypothetical protein
MNSEFANIKEGANIGDLYNPAIEIAKEGDKEKAKRYFDALVKHCYEQTKVERPEDNVDEEEMTRIVHSNLGYWAGYHEKGTIEKVHSVYGSTHPVFGNTTPTSSEAFNMGLELGKKWKAEGKIKK